MKPPPFEYDDPDELADALGLLARYGDDAKVLAGGQSLVPLLNFRLARPGRLIDVNRIAALDYVRLEDATLRIGALTRQATLESSPVASAHVPLLGAALRFVGHLQIRNRGTVGGSVAHADPAAELPVAFAALDSRFHVRSKRGDRVLSADELFVTHLTTSLEPDELLVEIEVPVPPARTAYAFAEFARRHGDFALGGAAVLLQATPDGTCERAAVALLAAAPTPSRAREAETWLVGQRIDGRVAAEAAERATAGLRPSGDIHGGSEYRRSVVQAMVRRALLEAAERGTASA